MVRANFQEPGQGRAAAGKARRAWAAAVASFGRYEAIEAAWKHAAAALAAFRPDGRLNDRAGAEAELAAACVGLRAAYWRKLRGYLQDRRTLLRSARPAPPAFVVLHLPPVPHGTH